MPSRDLRRLREADAALAAIAPSPQLAARIRAHARAGRTRAPLLARLGLEARQLRRPLLLALALTAALLLASARRGLSTSDRPVASRGPEDSAAPITDDRARADAGPDDRLPGRRRAPPPMIHAPNLEPGPRAIEPDPASPPRAPSSPEPLGAWREEVELDRVAPILAASAVAPPRPRSPIVTPASAPAPARTHAAAPASEPPPPPASSALPPPGPSACTSGALGQGACTDYGVFKLQASNDLCAAGLSLADFQIEIGTCAAGQAERATFTCCPTPPAEPAPKKDPGSAGGACATQSITVAACVDVSALEGQATDACAAVKATLTDRKFSGACPDGQATDAWFTCCAAAPPPDPASCVESTITSGACQDEGVLKSAIVDACGPGLTLTAMKLGGACPEGQASDAQIVCCKP